MASSDIFTLGLGLSPPWRVIDQRLETDTQPHELHLGVAAEPGARFPCPTCGRLCKPHDWKELSWRHLNFFQHACIISARVPRADCPEHGVLRINVPWARPDSGFTLLFEQVALLLMREMPVSAAARFIGVTDQRLWRILQFYVRQAIERLDLRHVEAVALDETAARRGQEYVTVFIDLDAAERPVLFVTPGKGKECVKAFRAFLLEHGGEPTRIAEVVCDMSAAFLAAATENFPHAAITVDWFHVVQIFTTAVERVRRAEAHRCTLPKGARWAALKRPEALTEAQRQALEELETGGFATAEAYRAKEMLRWVRKADTTQAARWRLSRFLNHISGRLTEADSILDPVRDAVQTVRRHAARIIRRWASGYSNARLEALNGLFQAARARARGYRSAATFACIIYLIGAPITELLAATLST
ncbi:MAG: ISL3 family transposase [Mycobacterium sp.]|jgi:transposase|uniref:ISL3 family transposase n=1 Tax=Mycobacterium sp. TaxID=1785 RepID=UPI003F94F787